MADKVTAPQIRAMKASGDKIVCLTAYDAYFGALADRAGVDVILVGDSLANVVLGYETTVPVTLQEMVHHVRATRRGVKRALLVADMPFGSYNSSVGQAVDSAVELMKAGAEAVKLEGDYPDAIEAIVKAGIPLMSAPHRSCRTPVRSGTSPKDRDTLGTPPESGSCGRTLRAYCSGAHCPPSG